VIFNVRHELTSYDLAYAIALESETYVGNTRGQYVRLGALTKTEVREIAKERVARNGSDSNYWPELSEDGLLKVARERIDQLWPKGA
jgi:hypothetical protein